jgi:hypothetical protein
VRPRSRIIREQLLERDPELATLLETAVELEIAAGSMVYARRDEPMVVVPSKGAFKWSLLLSAEEQAACSSGDVREILRLAVALAAAIVTDATARSRLPSTPHGEAYCQAFRASSGPPLRYASYRATISASMILPGDSDDIPQRGGARRARQSGVITAWLGEDGFKFSMYYLDDYGTVCRADRVQPLVGELDSIAAQAGFTYALTKRQVGLSAKCLGRMFDWTPASSRSPGRPSPRIRAPFFDGWSDRCDCSGCHLARRYRR